MSASLSTAQVRLKRAYDLATPNDDLALKDVLLESFAHEWGRRCCRAQVWESLP